MSVRLRNTTTQVVVTVADEKVSRLGPGWEPVEAKKEPAKRRTSAKKTDD